MNRVMAVFQALEGSWKIERSMRPLSQSFQGTAWFTKTVRPQEWHYQERGVLTTEKGEKLNSSREYLYRYENEVISVFFNEKIPRQFHTLKFDEPIHYPLKATASHLCKFDSYEATYVFIDENTFSLSYYIQGPEKNYRIDSMFAKQKEDV